MKREQVESTLQAIGLDPTFGNHTGELGQAMALVDLMPDSAILALDPLGIRRESSLPGEGSVVLEWVGNPQAYGFRLLRFQTHGYGGFYVTTDQQLNGVPDLDSDSLPWFSGRRGNLQVSAKEASRLVHLLFAWFFSI